MHDPYLMNSGSGRAFPGLGAPRKDELQYGMTGGRHSLARTPHKRPESPKPNTKPTGRKTDD